MSFFEPPPPQSRPCRWKPEDFIEGVLAVDPDGDDKNQDDEVARS